ncbi:hypothetical protein SUGI_0398900 [Cryptomeria japonica]|nr:hypothetical protein SUGI_0398900 [Cryptomeria japonica]
MPRRRDLRVTRIKELRIKIEKGKESDHDLDGVIYGETAETAVACLLGQQCNRIRSKLTKGEGRSRTLQRSSMQ